MDLKAAFDSVDRGIVLEAMKEKGIRESLIMRIENVLREMRSTVGGEVGDSFWTAMKVRQECPLSFNIVLADLEREG